MYSVVSRILIYHTVEYHPISLSWAEPDIAWNKKAALAVQAEFSPILFRGFFYEDDMLPFLLRLY
jgi:hypothetical protein